MRPIRLVLVLLLVALSGMVGPSWARSSSHSHSSGGTVHVRGYYRKDGTYVQPYDRATPGTGESRSPSYLRAPSHTPRVPSSSWKYGEGDGSHIGDGSQRLDFYGIHRDSHGRIVRSEAAKHAFERMHPCPSTGRTSGPCPGYVIDHIKALKHGGADSPSNMQWQTVEAAKEKDKWE